MSPVDDESSRVESSADGHGPRRLSPRESAITAELRRIDPQLAGLYEHGLRLADRAEEAGVPYLIAHAGRELSRAVVTALTGEVPISPEATEETIERDDRFRARIASALEISEGHPYVGAWFSSHKLLVSGAHWRKSPPSGLAIREAFGSLAGLLFGRVAPYFDTQSELDRLLALETPDEADLASLKACSVRYTQTRYFFTRISNPAWLPLLARAGFFRNPPERRIHADQSWSLQAWPEGDALARLSSHAPDLAVAEFLSIPPDNSNPAVWNSVASAAITMAPDLARRLVPLLAHALRNAPPVLFPRTIIKVIKKLAEAEDHRAAFRLTDSLLFVRSAEPKTEEVSMDDQ